MIEVKQENGEHRAVFMLRVAAAYIRDHYPDGMIRFDEAECDGYCVADDCEVAAEMLSEGD